MTNMEQQARKWLRYPTSKDTTEDVARYILNFEEARPNIVPTSLVAWAKQVGITASADNQINTK